MKGTITVAGQPANAAAIAANRNNKQVKFKNCPPSTDFNSEINNAQVDNTKDLEFLMSMYKLMEHSNNEQ